MDHFLKHSKGVIHIGGHYGEEKDLYEKYHLNVLWIEAMQESVVQLIQEIKSYSNQRVIQALVLDVDDKKYNFYISSNEGASSSIFQLDQHKMIWPEINLIAEIELESITLNALVKKEKIDLTLYDSLVLDTQGSELLILKGAGNILKNFKYIKTEAANFQSYQGGCLLHEIENYLQSQGFELVSINEFASAKQIGSYYDVVYTRKV